MPHERVNSHRWIADASVVAALGLMVVLLALWFRSHVAGGHETFVDGPGGSLQLLSRDGWFMAGLGSRNSPAGPRRIFWRRSEPLDNLKNDPQQVFDITPFRFAFAVPHVLLAALLGVVPAWRWVYRERVERQRRRLEGLCRECGYDLRAAVGGRCPECGSEIGALKVAPPANTRIEAA